MGIKVLLNKVIQKAVYRYRADSDEYIKYLKKIGVEVGEGVNFYSPTTTEVDIQNPHLLKIGDYVHITSGVRILTHDFSWAVLKRKYGEILGGEGEVHIGNNVFIGVNTTILRNTHIGDNVIIGANSVIHGDIPSDCVVAGNPAHRIMSLDEYYKKSKLRQNEELEMMLIDYTERFGKTPNIDVLSEYFWMFTNEIDDLSEKCKMQMKNCGNEKESYELFIKHTPEYQGLSDAINKLIKK